MKTRIGFLMIATKKYTAFIDPLIASARPNFFNHPDFEVEYIVLTDAKRLPDGLTRVHQRHEPWPYITLKRFHMFEGIQERLKAKDYLFYCDADMRFVKSVGPEILSSFTATRHPYFYQTPRTGLHYEGNPDSTAYVGPNEGQSYYIGAFYGAQSSRFLEMTRQLRVNTDKDLENGIIAKWHDESHLNRYLVSHPPALSLDPGYCYPEGQQFPFEPKIIAVEKPYLELRRERPVYVDKILAFARTLIGRK